MHIRLHCSTWAPMCVRVPKTMPRPVRFVKTFFFSLFSFFSFSLHNNILYRRETHSWKSSEFVSLSPWMVSANFCFLDLFCRIKATRCFSFWKRKRNLVVFLNAAVQCHNKQAPSTLRCTHGETQRNEWNAHRVNLGAAGRPLPKSPELRLTSKTKMKRRNKGIFLFSFRGSTRP